MRAFPAWTKHHRYDRRQPRAQPRATTTYPQSARQCGNLATTDSVTDQQQQAKRNLSDETPATTCLDISGWRTTRNRQSPSARLINLNLAIPAARCNAARLRQPYLPNDLAQDPPDEI